MENNWFQNPWATNQWMPGGAEFEKWAAPINDLDSEHFDSENNTNEIDQKSNYYLAIVPKLATDKIFLSNTNSPTKQSLEYYRKGWEIFADDNILDLFSNHIKSLPDNSIQNLVIESHGSSGAVNWNEKWLPIPDDSPKRFLQTSDIEAVLQNNPDSPETNKSSFKYAEVLKKDVIPKIATNGNLIFFACNVGLDIKGKEFVKKCCELGADKISVIAAQNYIQIRTLMIINNIKRQDLGLQIAGTRRDAKNTDQNAKWIKCTKGSLTYHESLTVELANGKKAILLK